MRRKENIPFPANMHPNNLFTKNASRKHSALGLQQQPQPKPSSRQFKPRFILKSKQTQTPTNRFCDNSGASGSGSGASSKQQQYYLKHQQCYEYDDVHETFRKYEQEKKEMQRLFHHNREYRAKLLKLNVEYQAMKERKEELERENEIMRAGGGGNMGIGEGSREHKFASTIATITAILEEVVEDLADNRTKRGRGASPVKKLSRLLQSLHLYTQEQ